MKKIPLIVLFLFFWIDNAYAVLISDTGSLDITPASISYVELETAAHLSGHTTVGNLFYFNFKGEKS